jgi:hypothetical protein
VPRHAPLLSFVWCAAFYLTIHYCLLGIHGLHELNWHYISDALSHLINMVLVSCVWLHWSREERHPELLPKAEFERRYPPGPGSDPASTPTLDLASPTLGLKTVQFTGFASGGVVQPLRRTEYPEDE